MLCSVTNNGGSMFKFLSLFFLLFFVACGENSNPQQKIKKSVTTIHHPF